MYYQAQFADVALLSYLPLNHHVNYHKVGQGLRGLAVPAGPAFADEVAAGARAGRSFVLAFALTFETARVFVASLDAAALVAVAGQDGLVGIWRGAAGYLLGGV